MRWGLISGYHDSHFWESVHIQSRASSLHEKSRALHLAFPGSATLPSSTAKVRGWCPSGFESPSPLKLLGPEGEGVRRRNGKRKEPTHSGRVEEGLGPPFPTADGAHSACTPMSALETGGTASSWQLGQSRVSFINKDGLNEKGHQSLHLGFIQAFSPARSICAAKG